MKYSIKKLFTRIFKKSNKKTVVRQVNPEIDHTIDINGRKITYRNWAVIRNFNYDTSSMGLSFSSSSLESSY